MFQLMWIPISLILGLVGVAHLISWRGHRNRVERVYFQRGYVLVSVKLRNPEGSPRPYRKVKGFITAATYIDVASNKVKPFVMETYNLNKKVSVGTEELYEMERLKPIF